MVVRIQGRMDGERGLIPAEAVGCQAVYMAIASGR